MTLSLRERQVQAWAGSGLLHLVLLGLFLLVGVQFEEFVEEYSEVVLMGSLTAPPVRAESDAAGVPVATAPEESEASAAVSLPERRPSVLPSDELVPLASRRETDLPLLDPPSTLDRLTRTGQERPTVRPGDPAGERITPTGTGLPEGLLLRDPFLGAGQGSDLPFLIQWVGTSREVVRSVLPEYPPGIEREVTLQFRFSVTPAGEVTAIRPLQRGDPTLEEAALTALRQWTFQPLPGASVQEKQEAVIAFRFRIRS